MGSAEKLTRRLAELDDLLLFKGSWDVYCLTRRGRVWWTVPADGDAFRRALQGCE